MSARAFHRILKLARTIADLAKAILIARDTVQAKKDDIGTTGHHATYPNPRRLRTILLLRQGCSTIVANACSVGVTRL